MGISCAPLLALVVLAAADAAYDCSTSATGCTPLDDYVAKPDASYEWVDMNQTIRGPGWTAHLLNMTSQSWLTSDDWEFAPRSDGTRAGASPVSHATTRFFIQRARRVARVSSVPPGA